MSDEKSGQEPEKGEPQEPADGTEEEPSRPGTGDQADGGASEELNPVSAYADLLPEVELPLGLGDRIADMVPKIDLPPGLGERIADMVPNVELPPGLGERIADMVPNVELPPGLADNLAATIDKMTFPPGVLDGIRDQMDRIAAMVDVPVPSVIEGLAAQGVVRSESEPFDVTNFPIDDSHSRTAEAAEATADAARETARYTAQMLEAMRESVELNQQIVALNLTTRQDNIAAQGFTKTMAKWSLAVAILGVLLAGVSLIVAAQPNPAPVVNIPPDPAPTINVTVVPTPEATPAP